MELGRILVLIGIGILIFCFIYNKYKYKCMKPNGSEEICYNVLNNTRNMQEKVDLMYTLDSKIRKLELYLVENHPDNVITRNLQHRYKSIIYEAEPEINSTTYTINKSEIFMCMTTRDEHELVYDINTLMYVIIHELGHICNDTHGHTETFNKTFKFLLENAVKANVYGYVDYKKNPINYCGLILDSQILDY